MMFTINANTLKQNVLQLFAENKCNRTIKEMVFNDVHKHKTKHLKKDQHTFQPKRTKKILNGINK